MINFSSHVALYIDPGSGTVLWQVLSATAVAGLFTIRTKLVELFRKRQ